MEHNIERHINGIVLEEYVKGKLKKYIH